MSGDRARQRNLKNQIGETAAAAVLEMREQVQQIAMTQRVLAAQMLDFERTVATVRAGRAHDTEECRRLVGEERTHRLKLAEEQRAYVDRADKVLQKSMDLRSRVATADFELLLSELHCFESMTFWQRLRWNFTGALPPIAADAGGPETPEPVIADGSDGAYPGDGL